jgi:hypothetical protein
MLAKDAFDSVCNLVFENLKDDGWKYSKSKHWITKKDKNLQYRIYFFSSWRNISDINVCFYGAIEIKTLKSNYRVFGLDTMNFKIPDGQLYWNIAKEESWTKTVQEFTDWLNTVFFPIVNRCTNDLNNFVLQVTSEGFYPEFGYLTDIDFVLQFGSRELAEKATINYYNSLNEDIKKSFKENYESLIVGNEAISDYGRNWIRMYSNFKMIIENKIIVKLI